MPKTPIFSKLFGPSPITPIQEHMVICEECAGELLPFFDAVFKSSWKDAEKHFDRIDELENDADEIKKNLRLGLPRSLFLPVPRHNLLEIVQVQDKIANGTKDIAGLILGRKMRIPAEVESEFKSFVAASIKAVQLAREAMDELNDLVVTGFSGQEIEFIEKILQKLHDAENESDIQQVGLRRSLFDQEGHLNPVDVVFIYRVIDQIGDVADDAQTVGNRMMYVIAN